MRWMWIDTVVEFVSGERASAVKNVTLAEDYLEDHFPGYPVFPVSLMIEGLEAIDDRAAVISGVVLLNGKKIGAVELIFSHVDQAERQLDLPDHNFVFTDSIKRLLPGVGGPAAAGESPSP